MVLLFIMSQRCDDRADVGGAAHDHGATESDSMCVRLLNDGIDDCALDEKSAYGKQCEGGNEGDRNVIQRRKDRDEHAGQECQRSTGNDAPRIAAAMRRLIRAATLETE